MSTLVRVAVTSVRLAAWCRSREPRQVRRALWGLAVTVLLGSVLGYALGVAASRAVLFACGYVARAAAVTGAG